MDPLLSHTSVNMALYKTAAAGTFSIPENQCALIPWTVFQTQACK